MKKSKLQRKLVIAYITCTLCMFSTISVFAQQVIATSGNYYKNANGSASWTIGELVTETYSNGNIVLTQGFQQSKLTVTTNYEVVNPKIQISAFPNPTSDFVTIKVDKNEGLNYLVIDPNGKILERKPFTGNEADVSFLNLPNSIYILKIVRKNTELKSFKIIKQ